MTAVILGLVFIVVGGWGLLYWFQDFIVVLRGFGPVSIFLGGLIAFVSGLASLRANSGEDNPKE